jgi:hypothetical protein
MSPGVAKLRAMKASPSLLILASLLGFAACSDDESVDPGTGGNAPSTTSGSTTTGNGGGTTATASTSTGMGGDATGGGGDGGGGAPPMCNDYPFVVTVPDTEAAAIAELATFAPGATLTWNETRGTLSNVSGLGVQLDCPANGNDVWEAAWAVLEAHPDLFQLDRSEWAPSNGYPCSAVNDVSITNTGREHLAGIDVRKDILAIAVAPDGNGGVTLNSVTGFYLPVLQPGDIGTCDDLPDATLEANVRAQSYGYSTFFQCAPSGSGTYTPQPNDTIEWDESWWEWDDGTGTILANKRRAGRLIIHEDNWTQELLDSDLNCPDPNSDERILGYTITVDPITGEVSAMPGIGCIVC